MCAKRRRPHSKPKVRAGVPDLPGGSKVSPVLGTQYQRQALVAGGHNARWRLKRIATAWWKLSIVVLTIVAAIASMLSYLPQLSVTTARRGDTSDYSTIYFIIRNEGYLPLKDVDISCRYDSNPIKVGDVTMYQAHAGKTPEVVVPYLSPKSSITSPACDSAVFPESERDETWVGFPITVVVRYKPFFFPFLTRTFVQRFLFTNGTWLPR